MSIVTAMNETQAENIFPVHRQQIRPWVIVKEAHKRDLSSVAFKSVCADHCHRSYTAATTAAAGASQPASQAKATTVICLRAKKLHRRSTVRFNAEFSFDDKLTQQPQCLNKNCRPTSNRSTHTNLPG